MPPGAGTHRRALKRPTIVDVAERAGVSKSLVSLVMRDSPRVGTARSRVDPSATQVPSLSSEMFCRDWVSEEATVYDNVRRGGGLLFVIGMVGRGPDGAPVAGGIGPQTRAALERIEAILKDEGRSRADIVRLRFYVVDMRLWPAAREEVRAFFGEPIPPATAVGVTGLVDPDLLIEIDAEAAAE